jgi:hypothetical protein
MFELFTWEVAMRFNRAFSILCGGGIFIACGLLIAAWGNGTVTPEGDSRGRIRAVKEDLRRERLNALAAFPVGRKEVRPTAGLEAGWRELPIDKAIVHSLGGVGTGDGVLSNGHFKPRAIEVTIGRIEWSLYCSGLEVLSSDRFSSIMETYVGITPEQYVLKTGGIILELGDLEVRLMNEREIIARSVGGVILPEDAAGVVILPEDATIGRPFKPANRALRSNRKMLARWFRDACRYQRRNHVPQGKAGSPFCIFSTLLPGEGAICDHDHSKVEVKSLSIRGNRIVLTVNFVNWTIGSRRSHDWWLPLVEVPISDCLPVGRYSVQVDWEGEGDYEAPCGSHVFTFDVVK